ncbi:50S ribosomal protein L28 [Maribellus maritimus]|uniref:50S ribosomal protein L28 n=1 Tax=Maribellus maritimus TaxID=2870838 RepID=UPI001EEC1D09|nr:50S ribosomal protein L28 [Maribellus maritimus]MCG6186264.1 50S ribosomal protein L28 [Maribellus maritimus]
MSRVCQITGKKALVGNNVSHSKRRTKRTFDVNLFKKKFYLPDENRWVNLTVSAAGIRTINKNGVKSALQNAVEKGYIDKY